MFTMRASLKANYLIIFCLAFIVFPYQNLRSEIIFQSGFEEEKVGCGDTAFIGGIWGLSPWHPDHTCITNDPQHVHSGSLAYKCVYEKGVLDGDNGSVWWKARDHGYYLREIYVRFYMQIPTDWVWDGIVSLKVVRNWRNPDPLCPDPDVIQDVFYFPFVSDPDYLPPPKRMAFNAHPNGWHYSMCPSGHEPGYKGCTNIPSGMSANGNWQYIEYHIKLCSTHGAGDGVYQIWTAPDGESPQLILDDDSVDLCNSTWDPDNPDTATFNELSFGNNISAGTIPGSGYQSLYFDDIAVGTSRIGPLQTGPDTIPPNVSDVHPAPNDTDVPVNTNISFHIQDSGDGVNADSIQLTVDGQKIAQSDLQITGNSSDYAVVYDPPTDFGYDRVITVSIDAQDLHNPPNVMPQDRYSFTTESAPDTDSSNTATVEWGDRDGSDYTGTCFDTYINAGAPNTNYSSDTFSLKTYTWPDSTIANAIIIKWDLSAFPESTKIKKAQLYLYLFDAGGDKIYDLPVHKIINVNPIIGQCTWNTYDGVHPWPGGQGGGQQNISPAEYVLPCDTVKGYKVWDVTEMVQDWVANPSQNFGMMINSDNRASRDSWRYFIPTESRHSDQRPRLIITYTGPGPAGRLHWW